MQLVHCFGNVNIDNQKLKDDEFSFEVEDSIRLKRIVEICQWERMITGGALGTGKTYSFKKLWSHELIDSSEWEDPEHVNPIEIPMERMKFMVEHATLGKYKLTQSQLQRLTHFEQLELTEEMTQKINAKQFDNKLSHFKRIQKDGDCIYVR